MQRAIRLQRLGRTSQARKLFRSHGVADGTTDTGDILTSMHTRWKEATTQPQPNTHGDQEVTTSDDILKRMNAGKHTSNGSPDVYGYNADSFIHSSEGSN